jgi:hypothetical protein
MQTRQWRALGLMFAFSSFVTMIFGSIASAKWADPDTFIRIYVYFGMLLVIATITCFICGALEKE